MFRRQRPQGIRHDPRLEDTVGFVGDGDDGQRVVADLDRSRATRTMGVYGEVASDGAQPGTWRPALGAERLRMTPRTQQRLLHDVLRTLSIAVRQPRRVCEQRTAVLLPEHSE